MDATRQIARFIVETPSSDIPEKTLDAIERSFFDAVGVAVAGTDHQVGQVVQSYARARGCKEESTVFGSGFRTSAPEAALTNGTIAHIHDYDDVGAYGHPTVGLMPALIAVAELSGATGQQMLESYAIGFEVALALNKDYDQYSRGFHSTALFGTMASAAACSRLLGLDIEQTMSAIGIAASEASGVGRNNGTMVKSFHAGLAARNGVMAALLAQEGLTAAVDILEAKQGFLETFLGDGRYNVKEMVASLGNPFSAQDRLSIKHYPCCAGNHSALDAVLSIVKEHNITMDDVEQVEVQAMTYTSPVLRYPEPKDGLAAKFSVHHAVAVALTDGEVRKDHFTDECATSERMKAARAKVRAEVMPRWDPRFMYGKHDANPVEVRTNDGRVLTACFGRNELKGSPGNPHTEAELVEKFRDNVSLTLKSPEAIDEALKTWRDIRSIKNVRDAMKTVCV